MVGSCFRVVAFLGALLGLTACQSPNVVSLADPALPGSAAIAVPVSAPMPPGAPLGDAPPGYVSFCLRFPNQCSASAQEPAVLTLSPKAWQALEQVNLQVNNTIWPEDDQKHFGRAEYWTIPTDGYGSCHDYALTKRKELIDIGLPQRALRIAILTTPSNQRHAVLTIATDKGDYVLDNLRQDIRPWLSTGYQWIARQDDGSESGWAALNASSILEASLSSKPSSTVR